jgi:hypothetical protein
VAWECSPLIVTGKDRNSTLDSDRVRQLDSTAAAVPFVHTVVEGGREDRCVVVRGMAAYLVGLAVADTVVEVVTELDRVETALAPDDSHLASLLHSACYHFVKNMRPVANVGEGAAASHPAFPNLASSSSVCEPGSWEAEGSWTRP